MSNLSELSKRQKQERVDTLLARAEQAFRLRQFIHSQKDREALGEYGRGLVGQAVKQLKEVDNDPK